MRSKALKRPPSTAPASTRGSDEGGGSVKRVRWESRSDNDEEMGTITASDDFEGTGEEGSTTPDNEKVRLFSQRCAASWTSCPWFPSIDLSCN